MIQEELNDAYKKIVSTIDREFSEEVLYSVSRKLNGMLDKIMQEIDYCIKFDGISSDFNIRQRDIEEIIEESKSSYKRIITHYQEEVENTFKKVYIEIQEIMTKSITNEEKTQSISKLNEFYKSDINSIIKESQDDSIELYDQLDMYFRRNSGNEDIYYEIRSFLKRDKEDFIENFNEAIKFVIKKATQKYINDFQNIVYPHLGKEEEKEEEKQEQVEKEIPTLNQEPDKITTNKKFQNTSNKREKEFKYSFKEETKIFVDSVKSITKKDIPESIERQIASNLDQIIQVFYSKFDQIGIDTSLKIQQSHKENIENYANNSNLLLENYYIIYEKLKKQVYDNNIFNSYLVNILHINVENLNQNEREALENLTKEYNKKFNSFVINMMSESYYKNTNYIKNNFGIEYKVQNNNEIEQNDGIKM